MSPQRGNLSFFPVDFPASPLAGLMPNPLIIVLRGAEPVKRAGKGADDRRSKAVVQQQAARDFALAGSRPSLTVLRLRSTGLALRFARPATLPCIRTSCSAFKLLLQYDSDGFLFEHHLRQPVFQCFDRELENSLLHMSFLNETGLSNRQVLTFGSYGLRDSRPRADPPHPVLTDDDSQTKKRSRNHISGKMEPLNNAAPPSGAATLYLSCYPGFKTDRRRPGMLEERTSAGARL